MTKLSVIFVLMMVSMRSFANDAAFKWADVPKTIQDNLARTLIAGGTPLDVKDPVAAPVIAYANKWIDFIDSSLRANPNFKELALLPKPHFLLVKSKVLDAMATSAPVCYQVNVRFKAAKAKKFAPAAILSGEKTVAGGADPRDVVEIGSYQLTDAIKETDCVQSQVADSDLNSFAEFLGGFSACKTEVYKDGKESGIQLKDCPLSSVSQLANSKNYDGATHLLVSAESNWITMTTGLLAAMDTEADFVSVLAHELSHYYNAHIVASKDKYGYFFKATESRQGIPSAQDLIQVENKWPYELDGLLGLLYGATASTTSTSAEINPLLIPVAKVIATNGTANICKSPSDTDLASCLQTIALNQGALSKDNEATLNDVQTAISVQFKKFNIPYIKLEALTNMKEVFVTLSQTFEQKMIRARELLEQEKQTSLGHYSFEQEADEKSLLILNTLGIAPSSAVNMILHLGQKRQQEIGKPFLPVQSADDCLALFNAETFSWATAPYPYVHLGTISDPHHQYCYRAKNMFDRAQANSLSNVTTFKFQTDTWQKIKPIAASLVAKPAVGPAGRFTTPLTRAGAANKKAGMPIYRLPSPLL